MGTADLDFYQVLGISRTASMEEVRTAYFEAARSLHPDVNPLPEARERFLLVQRAYEILSHPERRAEYDLTLPFIQPAPSVSMTVKYSRSQLPMMDTPQLVYALVEFVCTAKPATDQFIPLNICLVLDCSSSMKGERLDMVKSSTLQMLRLMKPNDLFSVIAFNDRAEIVIPTTRISDAAKVESRISMLQTAGGTEILRGLEAGFGQLQQRGNFSNPPMRHLILLTDGHTYGDEENCIQIAQEAERDGVVISAFGIGSDWNDKFLDKLTGISGGNTLFINSANDLERFLEQKIRDASKTFAHSVAFQFSKDPNVELRYAFRLSPDNAPLSVETPINLGPLQYNKHLSILFEFYIPRLPQPSGRLQLAEGVVDLQSPLQRNSVRLGLELERPVSTSGEPETPPLNIVEALQKLTLYRLQERARNEVASGDLVKATRHLQYLATHLLSSGNRDLAHTVLIEAEHIKQSRQFSREGDKRIKYGTRALLLPSGLESKTL